MVANLTKNENHPYYQHVDGLRGLAVLWVVFFHFDVRGFSGGFVGVDVFFVISGFLVSQILFRQIEAKGKINWKFFWRKRVTRLFPSFFMTVFFSYLTALVLFSSPDLKMFSRSLVFALMGLANFNLYLESGYFDAAANQKPLLHLWSLAVEEQFYLIWPFFVMALGKLANRSKVVVCLTLLFVSLVFAEWVRRLDPSAAFYLTPFRIGEFLFGGFIACLKPLSTDSQKRWWQKIASIIGLILTAFPVFYFDKNTDFPGINASIPCIGTCF